MLHYETVMRLHKAKEETKLFGIAIALNSFGPAYGYGCIYYVDGSFKARKYPKNFSKKSFLSEKFHSEIKAMNSISEYYDSKFGTIEEAVESVLKYFRESKKGPGEFTDLKNIEEIIGHLEKENLKYIIFEDLRLNVQN